MADSDVPLPRYETTSSDPLVPYRPPPSYDIVLCEKLQRNMELVFSPHPLRPAGERIIPLGEPSDENAAHIILALIHDCFIVTHHLSAGRPVQEADAFSLRFRLLSLYIVGKDLERCQYQSVLEKEGLEQRYQAIEKLLTFRQSTLFATDDERRRIVQDAGALRRDLVSIIDCALAEPFKGLTPAKSTSPPAVLDRFRAHLCHDNVASDMEVQQLCDEIRAFFEMPPWEPPQALVAHPTPLTTQREGALLHDIVTALQCMVEGRGPIAWNRFFVSPAKDNRSTSYLVEEAHARPLVLARDVLCGLLAGPSTLQGMGALTYIRAFFPLLENSHLSEFTFQRFLMYIVTHCAALPR